MRVIVVNNRLSFLVFGKFLILEFVFVIKLCGVVLISDAGLPHGLLQLVLSLIEGVVAAL